MMFADTIEPPPNASRMTLRELPVQLPSSPARFQFPPQTVAEAENAVRSDYIAGIVAKALAIAQTKIAPTVAPTTPSFQEFLENVALPTVQKKTERDARTLATRRLHERVGFCARCKVSWRLDQTTGDNCPRCCDARILYPGIDLVDASALNLLASSLLDDDLSPATVRTKLTYLMTVLNAATDRGLIRKVKKPRVALAESVIRFLSDPELVAIYNAAAAATWPRHDQFSAPDFWRAFLVVMIAFGPRLGEITSWPWLEELPERSRKMPAGWQAAAECPRRELRHLELVSPFGWFVYLPAKQKGAKPLSLVLPVPAIVAQHLEKIRGSRRFIFDVYSGLKSAGAGDYRNVKISIYRQWYKLCDAAGVESDLRATPHDLRRTQESRYDLQLGKGTGGEVNGHASRSVSDTYYSQSLPRIHKAVFSLQFPAFPAIQG